jgi:hypothetical protein
VISWIVLAQAKDDGKLILGINILDRAISTPLVHVRSQILFVTQRFNRIERRRFAGRIVTEEYPDRC